MKKKSAEEVMAEYNEGYDGYYEDRLPADYGSPEQKGRLPIAGILVILAGASLIIGLCLWLMRAL